MCDFKLAEVGPPSVRLDLGVGGSFPVMAVPTGSTLRELVTAQVAASGREDKEDPFYLVDLGQLLLLQDKWAQCLPDVQPFYAVKCNTDLALLQTMASLGCGFDCASKAEIKMVLDLGVSPDNIIYANPCKQTSHLKFAARNNVSMMTFDSEVELRKVQTHFPTARLVLRIRADDPSALCQLGVKFGCNVEEGKTLLQLAKKLDMSVIGVSFHVGSNSKNPEVFLSALEMAHQIFIFGESLGFHFTLLDIGGGFPGTGDSGDMFARICRVIREGLEHFFSDHPHLNIIAEPGRYFACSTHTLAVNVISKRQISSSCEENSSPSPSPSPSFMYYINDGVYGSFNCILYDHITPSPLVLKSTSTTVYSSSVWGPTCDGLDKICDISLPELSVGDWLFFEDMGAYTVCAASNFNGFVKPRTYYYVSENVYDRFCQLYDKGATPLHKPLPNHTPSQDHIITYTPSQPPTLTPHQALKPHLLHELVKAY